MSKKEENLLLTAVDRFRISYTGDKDEREEFYQDICFAVDHEGCQWPPEIRKAREDDIPPRPCLTINKIPEKIDQVEGEFRQLRPAIAVKGVDSAADPKIAEIYEGIIRHIEYNSTARAAYNTAHSSVLHGGRGAWRIDIEDDIDDPFVRNIVINRIPNVLTVYWDQSAKKLDKSDANYVFITEELSDKEFEAQYPDENIEGWDADDKVWEGWRGEKTLRIAEYWWKEREEKTFLRINRIVNGVPTKMTVAADDKEETDEVLEEKTIKVPKVKWCKMSYKTVLKDPDTGKKINDWPSKYIPVIIELGKEVNIKGQAKTRGMVRFAKTPMQMYNYWSSTNTEQVALAPKIPYMATPKMIGSHKNQWDNAHLKNYPYLLFDPDPSMPGYYPRREQSPQLSTAMEAEMQRKEHDIMSAMGIYQASLGDRSDEKSGKAILAKQRQGNIGSYAFTDNFQMALIYSAKILIDLIPEVYDTERILRIRGEDDSEKMVPVNARPNAPVMQDISPEVKKNNIVPPKEGITQYINDLSIGKYDIVATIGPSYTTQREESAAMINDLMKTLPPEMAAALSPILIKMIDMPGGHKVIEILKKLLPPGIYEDDSEENREITPQMVQQAIGQAIEQFKQSQEGIKLTANAEAAKIEGEIKVKLAELSLEAEKIKIQKDTQDNTAQIKLEQEKIRLLEERLQLQQEELKTQRELIKTRSEKRGAA